jgi:hypothetical protein
VGSPRDALVDALAPLVSSGALAVIALWAAAAVVLPWVVRQRSPGPAAIAVAAWFGVLWVGSQAVSDALGGALARAHPRGALAGASVAAVGAATVWMARRRARPRPPGQGLLP